MKEEVISIRKIPDGHLPQDIGDMSFNRDVPRSASDIRDEWHIKLPCGHTIALRSPTHEVFETADGISVNPSIVCPNGDWHGFIFYSRMTKA